MWTETADVSTQLGRTSITCVCVPVGSGRDRGMYEDRRGEGGGGGEGG